MYRIWKWLCPIILIGTLSTPASAQFDFQQNFPPNVKNRTATSKDDASAKELRAFVDWAMDYVESPQTDIVIPNATAWFSTHFDPQLAKDLATHYASITANMQGLVDAVKKTRSSGLTSIRTRRASKAVDLDANGLQNAALQRMIRPVTLYTMEMVESPTSEKSGTTFWSFVLVDGSFRYFGKLEPLNPTRGDMVTDILCNLPLGKAEKLLTDKKLLEEGAVEFLRGRKILK